jgi:aspartate/methionine/tyrosine aminotransferase
MSEQIRVRVLVNYQLLQKHFADSSASVFQSEGGWYAILQLPQIYSDDDWAEHILARQNILVQPGHFFDMEKNSCVVVSLLPPSSLFEDTIKQLRRCIEK